MLLPYVFDTTPNQWKSVLAHGGVITPKDGCATVHAGRKKDEEQSRSRSRRRKEKSSAEQEKEKRMGSRAGAGAG